MSITITPFTKNSFYLKKKNWKLQDKKVNFSLVFQKKLVTKNAVFAWRQML
jgi:hypothetical protein